MAKEITIDGYIGPYAYSKQFIKSMLDDSKDEVTIKISSLGGDVDHALAIHDMLAQQGNVTIVYTGFNASSATILSLGASKIRMSENSFYLIHKVMSWVDAWGYMNEDQIEEAMQQLEKDKNNNAKITLQLAKMYAKKSGKPISDILDLMKQETWLSAEEAKNWGFVDEIFSPGEKVNYLNDYKMVAMISASGLPVPRCNEFQTEPPKQNDNFWNKLSETISKLLPNQNATSNSQNMNKQFIRVNKVLSVEKLDSTEAGVMLTAEQMDKIDQSLSKLDKAESDRDAAAAAKQTAETGYNNAVSSIDELNPCVKEAKTFEDKVLAIRAILASKPGVNAIGAQTNKDNNPTGDGVDWETLNALPHMQQEY